MSEAEDRTWQRLDKWLWCARFMKLRAGCARWVAEGGIRINRQPTDKPHARLRPGDVLTFSMGDAVRVIRVVALAQRRGPAPEARTLYEDVTEPGAELPSPGAEPPSPGAELPSPGAELPSPSVRLPSPSILQEG